MGKRSTARDAFGSPVPAKAEEDAAGMLVGSEPAGPRVDDVVLRIVPKIVRGLLIAMSLGIAILGLLGGVGALGEADVDGFALFLLGLLLAFMFWKRMWSSLAEFLVP